MQVLSISINIITIFNTNNKYDMIGADTNRNLNIVYLIETQKCYIYSNLNMIQPRK